MNVALGHWIATIANQRKQHTGEDAVQALTWVQEWVDTYQGAYRALGAPYGDTDDGLLHWLKERAPRLLADAIGPSAQPGEQAS
jgi:hypothetical protein